MGNLNILLFIEVITSILLIFFILMQNKNTSLNLSSMSSSIGITTKRGVEKYIHNIIIVLGVIFVINSVLLFVLQSNKTNKIYNNNNNNNNSSIIFNTGANVNISTGAINTGSGLINTASGVISTNTGVINSDSGAILKDNTGTINIGSGLINTASGAKN